MPWFRLTGDERISRSCATAGCGGQPTWRLEADGAGSDYCSGCRMLIKYPTTDRSNGHEWFHPDWLFHECCRVCSVSRQAPEASEPCSGPVQFVLSETAT